MLSRLLQRVLYTIPVIWLVVSLVFLLIHLVPGDPILQMLGEGAPLVTDVAATRHAYGLDVPLRANNTCTTGKASCTAISARRCVSIKSVRQSDRAPLSLHTGTDDSVTAHCDFDFHSCRCPLGATPRPLGRQTA